MKYKLNLGCGYERLDGWLNLDAAPDSAADRLMPAHDLDFPAGSVSEARAAHLIEHLGFFKAKYFLSECRRVLAPGGALLLETPHIERTFEIFLAGDAAAREAALGWVYGSETPGMGHVYCFPKDLLLELLDEAGFDAAPPEEFLCQPHRPALRVRAVRREGERAALACAFRRRLLDEGLAVPADELCAAGLERTVRTLTGAAGAPAAALEEALVSAPAALAWFALEQENEERPSPEAAACARLVSWRLQGRLAAAYAAGLERGAGRDEAFAAALAAGRALTAAALAGAAEPPGPGPAEGAPEVFTAATALAWSLRAAALRARGA